MSRVRYFFSDLAYWLKTHPIKAALALVVSIGLVAAAAVGVSELASTESDRAVGPAPQVVVRTEEPPDDPADLGFPAFATANTTRVAGADSGAVAAGAALATSPTATGVEGPSAVVLVDAADWASGIAASSLVAAPIGAPILLADSGELSELTAGALAQLDPQGGEATRNRQVFAVGDAPEPEGLRTRRIEGESPAEIAVAVAATRRELTGSDPNHILIASSDDPEFAMPAAAWAARSGDAVLFTETDSVPKATLNAIEESRNVPVYVLGSADVVTADALKQIEKATKAPVERAANEADPVSNAVEFARYVDGSFGWNINDPGHGFVVASTTRPSDAGAAAALSGNGTYGPLLLTDDAETLPDALEAYLLDLKPGFVEDPTRAVYNHVWIAGDASVLSVDVQVLIDEIVALAPIESGQGGSVLGLPSDSASPGAGANRPERPRRNEDEDSRNRR